SERTRLDGGRFGQAPREANAGGTAYAKARLLVAGRAGPGRRRPAADRPPALAAGADRGQRAPPPGSDVTLAEVAALLGGPAAGTFAMPTDCPAFRWQREWREGGASVVVQLTASAWRTVPQRPRTHERAARWQPPRTSPGRAAAA